LRPSRVLRRQRSPRPDLGFHPGDRGQLGRVATDHGHSDSGADPFCGRRPKLGRACPNRVEYDGMPRALASSPAASIASIHFSSSVPMLRTRAPAWATISRTSSMAWAMTGDAPSASSTLAVSFMTTKFVMLWMSGVRALIRPSDCAVRWARSSSDMGRPPEVVHRPVAGAERLGVLNGSLQEGPRFPGRLERLFSARQARHYGRRERAAVP